MMTVPDVERWQRKGGVADAFAPDLPSAPDWGLLWDRYNRVLLTFDASEDEIAARYAGGFLFLSAPPGAGTWPMAQLTSDMSRRGVAVVAPDLIQDSLSGAGCGMKLDDLARWRRSIRDAASGVVVQAGPDAEKSLIVWHDVCAALQTNRPVWVWSGGISAEGEKPPSMCVDLTTFWETLTSAAAQFSEAQAQFVEAFRRFERAALRSVENELRRRGDNGGDK